MGAIQQRQSSTTFYRIIDGSICLKSDTERDGYEPHTTTDPSTGTSRHYFIKRFDGLEGYLTGFERVDIPDKKVHGWKLILSDENGTDALSLTDNSGATTRALKMLRSVDLTKPLTISAWLDTRDGKRKTALAFKQDGQNVPQHWDKDNLPEATQRPNGKWDFSKQEDVLYTDAMKFAETISEFAVKVAQKASSAPIDPLFTGPDTSATPPVYDGPPENPDDIPF